MSQRIKGSEVNVIMTSPQGREESIDAVGSIDFTIQLELLNEGYLGESSNRYDDIFNGIEGTLELHLERGAFFALIERIKQRAQRRTPSSDRFDFMFVFNFPNGDRVRTLFSDVFFGAIPVNSNARGEYVSASIPFGCTDGRFLGAAG
jgi:hypothetical protein